MPDAAALLPAADVRRREPMTVQPLTSDMLCHVAELERQVFSHPWSEA